MWVFYVDKIEFMSLLNMGYKAQSDAAGGVQGYPNDEDILNLFSSLNVGGPKKKTLVKVQKPKKKAKDSAAGKKEGGGRRVTTAPFGATRSPKAFVIPLTSITRLPDIPASETVNFTSPVEVRNVRFLSRSAYRSLNRR